MAVGGLLVFAGLLTYGGSLVTEMVSSYVGFTGIIAGIVLIIVAALAFKFGECFFIIFICN